MARKLSVKKMDILQDQEELYKLLKYLGCQIHRTVSPRSEFNPMDKCFLIEEVEYYLQTSDIYNDMSPKVRFFMSVKIAKCLRAYMMDTEKHQKRREKYLNPDSEMYVLMITLKPIVEFLVSKGIKFY